VAGLGDSGRGDELSRFYDHWFEHVSRLVSLLGGPEADREDILQEVFLVVRRRLPSFDGVNPSGWLYRITRRQVRDFRNRSWVKHIFTRRRDEEPDALPADSGHPERELETKQKHRALGAILAKMNPERRVAFVFFEIDGLSGEEIARIQGVPLNTVWTRLRTARKEFFELAAKYRRINEPDARGGEPERAKLR
jgi:RNA polymerase sigma-70 factor, ECF subfamily